MSARRNHAEQKAWDELLHQVIQEREVEDARRRWASQPALFRAAKTTMEILESPRALPGALEHAKGLLARAIHEAEEGGAS